jgi:integrase
MAVRENEITRDFLLTLQPDERKYEVMDTELEGFGVRVSPKGKVAYILRWSQRGRDGSATLGSFPALPVAAARKKAKEMIGKVAGGEDPRVERKRQRAAQTVKEFFKDWLANHVAGLRTKTRKDYTRIVDKVLVPQLGGGRFVKDLGERDALDVKHALAAHPRSANLALSVLSSAMSTAEAWGQRAKGTNPCAFVERFEVDDHARPLDPDQLQAFAAWLDRHEEAHALPVGQLRLLLMTGARPGEVKKLEWEWLDLEGGVARIPRTAHKTGRKTQKVRLVALGPHAVELLKGRAKRKLSKWVFPGQEGPYAGLESWWQRRKEELSDLGLSGFRIYDLRHTFATMARLQGLELDDVGDLLGHTTNAQTRRYAHLMPTKLRSDAGKVESVLAGR